MANRRYIDFPIASSVGDSDIILIWQSGANKQTTKATFLSGLPENLDELDDVAISGLTNGQILRYDSVTGKWENTDQGNLDLNDLNDVSIVSPSNGQVLVYNSSTSKWENSSGGYVPYTGAVTTVNLGAQTIQAGSFVKAGGTSAQFLKADGSVDSNVYGTGTVTSVALTMPTAFSVANSPITTAGTLAVTGAGTVGQYIRGDGSLADFPESSGGGSSVSYYLNGSVAQGTIGGVAYKELNKVPILGAGTDFTIAADGYIASFLTDAGDPNLLEIPGGNWNFETYFSASSGGGTPTFYVELYKVNSGGTATLIASNSGFPELIAFGTNIISYFSTLAVPTTTLALTDRLAVRYYVTHSGRTITLHTEDNHLCQIVTTFTTGITALNGLTAQVQNFAVGTSGTDFAISSATATHTFNLPTASATNRGALSSADWSMFNAKQNALTNPVTGTGTTNYLPKFTGASTIGNSLIFDNGSGVGINTATPGNYILALNYTGANLSVLSIQNSSSTGYSGLHLLNNSGALMGHIGYANATTSTFTDSVFFGSIASKAVVFTTADSEKMRIFSGGNVHIGTTPSSDNGARLQVSGTATFTNSVSTSNEYYVSGTGQNAFKINSSGTYYGMIQNTAADKWSLAYGVNGAGNTALGTSVLSWTGSGLVGINTNNPNAPLTVQSNSGSVAVNLIGRNNAGTDEATILFTDFDTTTRNAVIQGTNSGLTFFYGSSTTLGMRLDGSGNVGIGVTPSAWDTGNTVKAVEISQGAFWGYGTTNVYLASNYYWSGSNRIYLKPAAAAEYSITNGNHEWYNSASGTAGNVVTLNHAFTITSVGRGLFGTQTASAGAGGFNSKSFHVNAEIVSMGSGAGFFWENRSGGVTASSNWYGWYTTSAVIYLYNGAANIASINTSTGAYTALSDINKKENFEASEIGLKEVLNLKPTIYSIKNDAKKERHLGFIAQEVKQYIPNAYVESDGFIGLNEMPIIAALTKAIQELKQEIDTLKN